MRAVERILHVGCGRKQLAPTALMQTVGLSVDVSGATVTHLDRDPALGPDVVCDLGVDTIPLPDDSVDLVIAFHVLEHIGRQGESTAWFKAFEELYRVLKPGGLIYGECPYYTSIWAWSDPTHTRAVSEHSFVFFNQDAYRREGSPISPYRIAADLPFVGMGGMPSGFRVIESPSDARDQSLRFSLTARKPLRAWWLH
jgi:SAM-dependent methyltransferase